MKEVIKRNKNLFIGILTVAIILVFWEIVSRCLGLYVALPTFSSVMVALGTLFTKGSFYFEILYTSARCILGYIVTFVLALFLGMAAGRNATFAAVMAPVTGVMKAMPVVAITLILSVWMDSAVLPAVIGGLLVFPVVFTQVKTAVKNIDPVLLDVMREMGGGVIKDTFDIYLPMILPYTLAGISATFGMNVKAVVSAELLSYTAGSIGYAIYFAKADFLNEIPTLFAYTVVAVLMSVIFEYALKLVFSKVTKKVSDM